MVWTPASRRQCAAAGQSPPEAGVDQQVLSTARCAAACVLLTSVSHITLTARYLGRKDLQVPLWVSVTQRWNKLGLVEMYFSPPFKWNCSTRPFYVRVQQIIRRKLLFSIGHGNIGVMWFLFRAQCNQLIAHSVTPPTEERMTYGSRKGRFHTCRFLFSSSSADIDPGRRKRFFPLSFSQLLVAARTLRTGRVCGSAGPAALIISESFRESDYAWGQSSTRFGTFLIRPASDWNFAHDTGLNEERLLESIIMYNL